MVDAWVHLSVEGSQVCVQSSLWSTPGPSGNGVSSGPSARLHPKEPTNVPTGVFLQTGLVWAAFSLESTGGREQQCCRSREMLQNTQHPTAVTAVTAVTQQMQKEGALISKHLPNLIPEVLSCFPGR